MIIFRKLRWKNILSTGNIFTEIDLNANGTTLIVGENGAGKCVRKGTKINVHIEDEKIKNKFEIYLKNRQKSSFE